MVNFRNIELSFSNTEYITGFFDFLKISINPIPPPFKSSGDSSLVFVYKEFLTLPGLRHYIKSNLAVILFAISGVTAFSEEMVIFY